MHAPRIPNVEPCPRCNATARRLAGDRVECGHCGFTLDFPTEELTAAELI